MLSEAPKDRLSDFDRKGHHVGPRHVLWDHDHFEDRWSQQTPLQCQESWSKQFEASFLLCFQETYLNQLMESEEDEAVWVIYTNKKSLLGPGAQIISNGADYAASVPRPILRHPILAERAKKLQLLNMPFLTKQARRPANSWWNPQ